MPSEDAILSLDETQKVIMAFARGRSPKVFSEEEGRKIVDWAVDVRVDAALLTNLLRGDVDVDLVDGEMLFRAVKRA